MGRWIFDALSLIFENFMRFVAWKNQKRFEKAVQASFFRGFSMMGNSFRWGVSGEKFGEIGVDRGRKIAK